MIGPKPLVRNKWETLLEGVASEMGFQVVVVAFLIMGGGGKGRKMQKLELVTTSPMALRFWENSHMKKEYI